MDGLITLVITQAHLLVIIIIVFVYLTVSFIALLQIASIAWFVKFKIHYALSSLTHSAIT